MASIRRFLRRLLNAVRPDRAEAGLEREIASHLALLEDEYRRRGMSDDDAQRAARRVLGGVDRTKELHRDARSFTWLDDLRRDLRYAVRTLARSPIFSLVAIVSLTLGIGANTAMFQLLNALLLRPLPVERPHELVEVNLPESDLQVVRGNFPRYPALTYPIWERVRERQQAFATMFAWADDWFNLAPVGEVRRVPGVWVTGDYFPVLGLAPAAGRLFNPDDDRPGCGLSGAVVSHDFWQRELNGDPRAIGQTLRVDAMPVEIIGVAPAGFNGLQVGRRFDVALLFCALPAVRPGANWLTNGTRFWVTAMGRLAPGWTIARTEASLRSIAPGVFAESLPADYPAADAKAYFASTLTATPAGAGRSDLRGAYATPLRLLLAMTGFVLLIACANLTNLMLARGAVRQRELSLRLALGASRGRLVSQLLCESVIIVGASAVAAALLAQALSQMLVRLIGTSRDPVVLTLSPDWRVLCFLAATALAACLLLGLTPALRSSRGAPGDALKAGTRSVAGDHESLPLRRALVVAQVAVSLVLVVGALLFARSLGNLLAEPLGFQPERVSIVDAHLPGPAPPPEAAVTLKRELMAGLRAMPGVDAVGETFVLPLVNNNSTGNVWMDGVSPEQARQASFNRVSRGYFDALGMRLLGGREIRDTDTTASPFVAVVNETFARTFVPGASPVGRRFRVDASPGFPEQVYEIVGLVADAKYRVLRDGPRPVAFIALAQRGGSNSGGIYLVRSVTTPPAFNSALREALARVHPNLRFSVRSLEGVVRQATLRDRVMAILSSFFGLLAALLAAVGLHGVVSYAVERRRREIGIRLALGASPGAVIGSVLRESGILVGAGLAIGSVLSLALTGAARTLLFGLEPHDTGTIAMAVGALAIIALISSLMPAQRAARVDPMSTLKDE